MQLEELTQFLPPFLSGFEAWALLFLRLIWGTVIVYYGWPMVKNPLHWMDAIKPSILPGFLQAIGAWTIFGGGIAMIAGFLTPLFALGLAGAMAIALYMHVAVQHHRFIKQPPDAPGDSYEASLVYLAIAIAFVFLGPGILSVDYLLFGR